MSAYFRAGCCVNATFDVGSFSDAISGLASDDPFPNVQWLVIKPTFRLRGRISRGLQALSAKQILCIDQVLIHTQILIFTSFFYRERESVKWKSHFMWTPNFRRK